MCNSNRYKRLILLKICTKMTQTLPNHERNYKYIYPVSFLYSWFKITGQNLTQRYYTKVVVSDWLWHQDWSLVSDWLWLPTLTLTLIDCIVVHIPSFENKFDTIVMGLIVPCDNRFFFIPVYLCFLLTISFRASKKSWSFMVSGPFSLFIGKIMRITPWQVIFLSN